MRAETESWREQRINYDDSSGSYHVAHRESELISTNIVLTVAAIEETEPTELPPLATTIDPDALDNLFTEDSSGRVTFSYTGYEITIHNDGGLEIVSSADVVRQQSN
ncbi:HalOD1 output domain-containing protein [Halogeometricum borinquense]|uniref:HalOD1 output domain-containing protein n=1 Tax=Halogeometricum borinquense TaxID=60847 RepID=UPI0034182DD2